MTPFDYSYRRRHLDGCVAISTGRGVALAQRDDSVATVFDFRLAEPQLTRQYTGRHGSEIVTIAALDAPVAAMRLWIWPDRPMLLLQRFDADGRCVLNRVDFTTPSQRINGAWYQTDLYLDMFISTDLRDYAILDEDELEFARANRLISESLHARVQAQADELARLLDTGQFGAWLAATCNTPFDVAALGEEPTWGYREFAAGEADGWPEGVA